MNEKQLQAKIVIDFSHQNPHERVMLWSTLNRTLSQKDGTTQLAMGLIKGVSDLLYFKRGVLYCFEIKQKGKRHSVEHVKRQMDWGRMMESQGAKFYIITSLEGFWSAVRQDEFMHEDALDLYRLNKYIDFNKKTVTF